MDDEFDLNLAENRKAELKVKISMLKRDMIELKRELERAGDNHRELNSKYSAAKEIENLRNYQRNNLADEIQISMSKIENMRRVTELLKLERADIERENSYIRQKTEEATRDNVSLRNYNEELITKRQLLEKEIQLLKERCNNNEKTKMDSEIINTTSQKQYEYINKEISENNRKINILQIKIDDLLSDIKRSEELLPIDSHSEVSSELNSTLEKKIETLKESVKLNENKIITIKREIDNVKEYIEEGEGERELLNKKLEELIQNITQVNQVNTRLNTFLSFLIESAAKKNKFMANESVSLERMTDNKNKFLNILKEINSYKDIVDNY